MKVYGFLFCLLFANALSQHSGPNVEKARSFPVVDALISSLQQERWNPHDGACLRATLDMLEGVKNNTLWATWVWDSIQLPSASLSGVQAYMGNYEQCLGATWSADQRHPGLRSQYCLVELKSPSVLGYEKFGPFDDTDGYYHARYFVPIFPHLMPIGEGTPFNKHYIGICLPSICSASSVSRISRHLLQLTHLPEGEVSVDPQNCATADEVREYPTGFYVFWTVVLILVVTTITSTLFCSNDIKTTALDAMMQSFCLRRNYQSLCRVSADDLRVMYGIRCITAMIVILLHEGFFSIMCPAINALKINKFASSRVGLAAMHMDIVVDTFFAMSGLLLVRGLMMGKQSNALHTLAKRYFRLIGPFALCVFYQKSVAEYMSSGPFWSQAIRLETEHCEKYWWKSLLMANTDMFTVCYTVTWYIACDFQIAVLGTFLFFLLKKNRKLGIITFVSVALALTVKLGLIVYWNKHSMVPFTYRSFFLMEYLILNDTYYSSLARVGPYFVGMIMGYIITTYKPAQYRNLINKKWSVIITILSLLLGFTMLAIGGIFADRPYDALESAVVAATNRTFWGVMICSLIGVCEYGSLNLIPSFLGWAGWAPLSKLSYCLYLLHPILLQLQKFSSRIPTQHALFNMVLNASGVLVLSTVLSLALHLILEVPAINISNKLFTDKSKHLEQNGAKVLNSKNGNTTRQNGHKAKMS